MTTMIALLRGVNVGGHGKISMQTLREICESLKLRSPQTYIQSGNVVFGSPEANTAKVALRIETAIEKRCGIRPAVFLRTLAEMKEIATGSPFSGREGLDPAKLVVSFLPAPPASEVAAKLPKTYSGGEELHLCGRELYLYFPDGQGCSKFPVVLDRILKTPATARNWNTVLKLLAMAEALKTSR